jgi:hypothetical protein
MSWTLKSRSAALALAAVAGIAGCHPGPGPAAEAYSTEPLVVDEAMQARDWPRTTAEFQATNVEAGATRFPYAPQTSGTGSDRAVFGPERSNAALDTVYFVGQSLALPFTYFWDRPSVKKTYSGVVYEPTYNAMPLMGPDESPWATKETKTVEPVVTDPTTNPDEGAPLEKAVTPGEPVDTIAPVPDATPAPEPDQSPAPAAEPMPEGTEPAPAVSEPMPAETEAAPAATDATPEQTEPVPAETEATPEPTEPAPAETESAPDSTEPAPEATEAAPEATESAPAEPATETPAEETPEPGADANK